MNIRLGAFFVLVLAAITSARATDVLTNWHKVHPIYKGTPYQHLTFGNGVFVGVALGPQSSALRISSDGYSWTNYPLPTANVRYLDFVEGRFMMSGGASNMFVSTNGIQWQMSNIGIALKTFACGDGRCAGLTTQDRIAYSSNKVDWATASLEPGVPLYGIAYGAGTFVAVGELHTLLYSTNGTSWHNTDVASPAGRFDAVTFACGKFTAIGTPFVVNPPPVFIQSTNGQNWTQFSPTPPQTNLTCPAVLGGLTARNGSDWSNDFIYEGHAGFIPSLPGTAFGNGRFVKVGGSAAGELILVSSNGLVWENIGVLTLKDLHSLAASSNMVVAVGAGGTIVTSTNGTYWRLEQSVTSNTLHGVTWDGTRFLAVGDAGTVVVSSNGNAWSAQSFPATNDLAAVGYANGVFTTVGSAGFIATRSNATWQVHASGTLSNLNAVTYGAGKWVVVGVGHIVISTNGLNWILAPQNLGYGPGPSCFRPTILRGVTYAAGRFVAVGYVPFLPRNIVCLYDDSFNAVMTSTNGLNWDFYSGPDVVEGASVIFANQTFIQGAYNPWCNSVLTSTNGSNYLAVSLNGNCFAPSSVIFFRNYLISVGILGEIYRTSPSMSLSKPRFLGPSGFQLQFNASGSADFRIEYADMFNQWQPLESFTESNRVILDPAASNSPFRIYRAVNP